MYALGKTMNMRKAKVVIPVSGMKLDMSRRNNVVSVLYTALVYLFFDWQTSDDFCAVKKCCRLWEVCY